MLQKVLLLSGLASSLVYAAVNVFVPMTWNEYSIANQTVSELSAIGAPTRVLWIGLVAPYIVLFAAFGWGVLRSPAANQSLRIVGWLILAYSVFNLYLPPMHRREVLAAGGGTLISSRRRRTSLQPVRGTIPPRRIHFFAAAAMRDHSSICTRAMSL
jgi:hypothetical protein